MKKNELTPAQLQARKIFVAKLSRSGWDTAGWEDLFAGDVSLNPEAQAEQQNAGFDLRASYYIGEGYVQLECVDRETQAPLVFRFYPKTGIDVILDEIIAAQDSLSPENYPEVIKRITPLCDLALFETADDLIQLPDGDRNGSH